MNKEVKVLLTGYEVFPFYKRGGLGDVLGSLPIALSKIGVDARLVMPYYEDIAKKYSFKEIGSFDVSFAGREELVQIHEGRLPNSDVPIYFLGNHKLIKVINLKKKSIQEFIFFDLAVCGFLNWFEDQGGFIPQILHCNDWHTALIPLILAKRMLSAVPTILTIHNLGYQGRGSIELLKDLGIKDEEIDEIRVRGPKGKLNALGEGMLHATYVTTVSQTYAREISNPKRTGIISSFTKTRHDHQRAAEILGILNGIDVDIWNPETDRFIPKKYSIESFKEGKKECRDSLLRSLGLEDRPTFSFVGRMVGQKGINILKKTIPRLSDLSINIIFLGSGDKRIEYEVERIVREHSGFVRLEKKFSEEFARKVYAGSDFLLIPSVYEPCGLIQMMAMRYGTLPIASRTGGLADSIKHNETGYLFRKGSVDSLLHEIKHALNVYQDKERHNRMIVSAMKEDFSWSKSAKEYKDLYIDIVNNQKT